VTARANAAAETVIAQAKDELAALERQAEARMAEIAADTEDVLHDRAQRAGASVTHLPAKPGDGAS
jgi:hypothetical protein